MILNLSYPSAQREIATERLLLRPFNIRDGVRVRELAGDARVADTTANIPHPYGEGVAEIWISSLDLCFRARDVISYAITHPTDGLIGCITLALDFPQRRAEVGYWIGVPFWGQGYATEAGAAMIEYGFRDLQLRRIHATCMARNIASARVLRKIGMRKEGFLRQHLISRGRIEDLLLYGILQGEFETVLEAVTQTT